MTNFDAQIPRAIDPVCGLETGPVIDTTPARRPQRTILEGDYVRLEPLDAARHGDDLYAASTVADAYNRFLFLPVDPPATRAQFDQWMAEKAATGDAVYVAVVDRASGRALGRQSLMRIDPAGRVIEIGDIYWGPGMSRSRLATEAQYLFMRHAFDDLGYRRYEWKCHALNYPSRQAALRFGFTYEGHFRRATIVKGRSRDTSWFSIIDDEWPAIRGGYQRWLAPANFDAGGRQRSTLQACLTQAQNPS